MAAAADNDDALRAARTRPPYGLRGWLLLLIGLTWIAIGVSFVVPPIMPTQSSVALPPPSMPFRPDMPFAPGATGAYTVVERYLPLMAWGVVWIVTGTLGTLGGVIRRHKFGFVVLSLMPFGWGIGLVAATIVDGSPRGWVGGVQFLCFAAVISITSRLEDARLLLQRRAANEDGPPAPPAAAPPSQTGADPGAPE